MANRDAVSNGRPAMSTTKSSNGILAEDAREERERIVEMIEATDPVTNDMVIAILHDEEGHRRLFEGFLREYQDQP
jgi:bacterioferritin (cytochrome b1)